MAEANSSAVVLASGRGPKDEKGRKKKAKVNVQEQPLYPYKMPVHQPGVDGFYCTYGCEGGRGEGRSRGRIRPVTVMYPEEGFVCCHEAEEEFDASEEELGLEEEEYEEEEGK